MPKPQHDSAALGEQLKSELDRDAPELARRLMGGQQPDATNVSRAAYAQTLAAHWSDPAFRQKMAAANPNAFLDGFARLHGVMPGEPGHSLTLPPTDQASPASAAVSSVLQQASPAPDPTTVAPATTTTLAPAA